MYNLKPILVDQDIQFPNCMYQLKPINNNLGNSANTINRNSVSAIFLVSFYLPE